MRTDKTISIMGDGTLHFGRIVNVMDAAKAGRRPARGCDYRGDADQTIAGTQIDPAPFTREWFLQRKMPRNPPNCSSPFGRVGILQ